MNCIKCGREIPDGELFCADCSRPSSADPAAKKAAPKTTAAVIAPIPAQRHPFGLIAALVIVSLIACASLVYVAYDYLNSTKQDAELARTQTELAQADSRYNTLNEELLRANDQIAGYQEDIALLNQKIDALEQQVNSSEGSANQSRFDLTEQQLEYDELSAAYTDLVTHADMLANDLAIVEADLAAAAKQLSDVTEELSLLHKENQELADTVAFFEARAVFVTVDQQTYYHHHDCPEIGSRDYWIYNKKLAESKGYIPCPVCYG